MLMDFYWSILALLKLCSLFWTEELLSWVPLPFADSWQRCAPIFASLFSPFC